MIRKILVDAIIDLASDELQEDDLITIAKETDEELAERLVAIAQYYRSEVNELSE